MQARIGALLKPLSLAQQPMLASLASLAILVSTILAVGWWIGREIEAGVIRRTASTTALYVDSVIAPHLEELARTGSLTRQDRAALEGIGKLRETRLGYQIVAFKVWDADGRVLFSTNPALTGRVFPVGERLARAWRGEVVAGLTDLPGEEHVLEREGGWTQLLEVYSPVRLSASKGDRIIAVAEFYQTVDDLRAEIVAAQVRSWLVVGAAMVAMYLVLAGLVRRGSNTSVRQQLEFADNVARLTRLLEYNEDLHARVRRAATRAAELNERFLRRISAELHDGPAQDVALALLRLDGIAAHCATCAGAGSPGGPSDQELAVTRASLDHALKEMRAIAAGLRLPELERLTLAETVIRAAHAHERRTATVVALSLDDLPEKAPLSVKITLYRVIQEALANAYHHAGGHGQRVRVGHEAGELSLEVSDQGTGFEWAQADARDGRLGLAGMRERIESLGGRFRIETAPGQGTRVLARLPLHPIEADSVERDDERHDLSPDRRRSAAVPGGRGPLAGH